jgi:hypothetical protein
MCLTQIEILRFIEFRFVSTNDPRLGAQNSEHVRLPPKPF